MKFAYGKNHVDSCQCPAVAAGYNPDTTHSVQGVAVRYDGELRDVSDDSGTVSEGSAKRAWQAAIEHFEHRAKQTPKQEDQDWYQERADVGKEIARELGWLE